MISSSFMTLNTVYMVPTSKCITPAWLSPLTSCFTSPVGYLVGISNAIQSKLNPWSLLPIRHPPPPPPGPKKKLHSSQSSVSVKGSSSYSVAQAKTHEVIPDSSFSLCHALYQFHQQILSSLLKYTSRNQPLLSTPLLPSCSKPLSFLTWIIAIASLLKFLSVYSLFST